MFRITTKTPKFCFVKDIQMCFLLFGICYHNTIMKINFLNVPLVFLGKCLIYPIDERRRHSIISLMLSSAQWSDQTIRVTQNVRYNYIRCVKPHVVFIIIFFALISFRNFAFIHFYLKTTTIFLPASATIVIANRRLFIFISFF